ncbi:MAG: response regulator, partial [Acidobacteriota bacterium]|nr:response regulator [Acidobacteriota bacterium]
VPPFDGLSLIRQARAVHPGLEAIAITGHSEAYTSADVVAAGASDLLMKPFRLDELHARVTLAAERRHAASLIHGQQAALQQTSTELIRDLQQQLVELRSNTGRADQPDA